MRHKLFWFVGISLIILLSASAYFSQKLKAQLDHDARGKTPPTSEIVVQVSPTLPSVIVSPTPEAEKLSGLNGSCVGQKEYLEVRQDLGKIVNDHLLRQYARVKFAKKIDKWRGTKGIPLAFKIDRDLAEKDDLVYNNCKPTCLGKIHQVFVSRLDGGRDLVALTKSGKLKKFPLTKAGIEVLTIDELNKKGVPFRSWKLPMDGGPWFVDGTNMYKGLDIEGVWLKVSSKGKWAIVPESKKPTKLVGVDALKVPGCSTDELCFSAVKLKRFFKAPSICGEKPTQELQN